MKLGLLGKGISYSYSPLIFHTLQALLNVSIEYVIFDREEDEIPTLIQELKLNRLDGLNVTKPYKETVIQYCDELSKEAKAIGSVNVLTFKDGKIIGHNTDGFGFLGLLHHHKIHLKSEQVCILGNGGSSKAVYESINMLSKDVMVFKRNESKRVSFSNLEFDYNHPNLSKCTLFIQTTTLGLNDNDPLLIDPNYLKNHTLIDLIYHRETMMMTHSKRSYGGIMMLIYQALKAYEIWDKKPIKQKDHIVGVVKEVLEHEFNRHTI